jgi:NAD(P)H-dependent FMN reductase
MKIKVIVGSTRQERFGDKPANWIVGELKKEHGVDVELLDLREYVLPFFNDPGFPSMSGGKYEDKAVQRWSDKIREADAFVIVTPEYNHGYPGVLKNAMDSIFPEWNHKPVGFIGYGSAGGARSIEQLRQVVVELQMTPIRNAIHLPGEIYAAVSKETVPVNPELFSPLRKTMMGDRIEMFISELLWSAKALKNAREADIKEAVKIKVPAK